MDLIYLTTSVGDAHRRDFQRWFDQFGIKYGGFNPNTGKVVDLVNGCLPAKHVFYPLTASESEYIVDDVIDIPYGTIVLTGSVLYKGQKYLAPTIWTNGPAGTPVELAKIVSSHVKNFRGYCHRDGNMVMALIPFDFVIGRNLLKYRDLVKTIFSPTVPRG